MLAVITVVTVVNTVDIVGVEIEKTELAAAGRSSVV